MKVGRRPTVSVNGHLQCKRCRLIKLLSSFPSCKKAICGHRGICNSCRSEKRRANRIGIKRGCRKSPITQDGEKWCYACKQVKPIDEYRKNKRAKDGPATHMLANLLKFLGSSWLKSTARSGGRGNLPVTDIETRVPY